MAKMNRLALLIFCIFVLIGGGGRLVHGADKVDVYSSGRQISVQGDDPCFPSIVKDAVALFETSNSGYRLIVTPDLIDSLKAEETGVEVGLDRPRRLTVKRSNATHEVSKFFIPLSGNFSEGHTTIFFAGPAYEIENQVINSVNMVARRTLSACVDKILKR